MVDRISGIKPIQTDFQTKKQNIVYDLHNISPKELDNLTLDLFKKGEISLKDRLPFIPLDMTKLSGSAEKQVHVKYYSKVWDDPNRKRDMLAAYRSVLQEQISDHDTQQNIQMTKNALTLLENLARSKQTFKLT
jgi:hypothetical protein